MPIPTPFHSRTAALCKSHEWHDWAGYLAVDTYEPTHEREYWAIRNSAALIDVTPLFKYEISGPDALRVVDRIITRDATKCKIGQVLYTPWCNEAGKIVDDGTVTRLAENHFRITAADPNLIWFQDCAFGFDATVVDVTADIAMLSLQGPRSREILQKLAPQSEIDKLKFFYHLEATFGGLPVEITRTGYTGDLGYEIWVKDEHAEKVYDLIFETGRDYGLLPCGLVAMDISRVEAGFLLADVDYFSCRKAVISPQYSSAYEVGLGWAVKLQKSDFVGKRALQAEKKREAKWAFCGIEADWVELEAVFAEIDLPPQVAGRAERTGVPIYKNGKQIGKATTTAFSPILKKYLALCTLESQHAKVGSEVEIEITIEYRRKKVRAIVAKMPFYDPPWKRR